MYRPAGMLYLGYGYSIFDSAIPRSDFTLEIHVWYDSAAFCLISNPFSSRTASASALPLITAHRDGIFPQTILHIQRCEPEA